MPCMRSLRALHGWLAGCPSRHAGDAGPPEPTPRPLLGLGRRHQHGHFQKVSVHTQHCARPPVARSPVPWPQSHFVLPHHVAAADRGWWQPGCNDRALRQPHGGRLPLFSGASRTCPSMCACCTVGNCCPWLWGCVRMWWPSSPWVPCTRADHCPKLVRAWTGLPLGHPVHVCWLILACDHAHTHLRFPSVLPPMHVRAVAWDHAHAC